MSTSEIALLGGIAGMTILLGLPLGRLRNPAPRFRTFLNAATIGILIFLLFDVLAHANEPVEAALLGAVDGSATWVRFAAVAAIFGGGIVVGLLGLVYYDKHLVTGGKNGRLASWSASRQLSLMIAVGIGLHNFSEGLAIGQSAASGEVDLALALIVGFGLHNATEGFGIVAPMAAEGDRPSWRFLAALGLIGGAPTFIGTLVGQTVVNDMLFIGFLAVAAGSILYVIVQLIKVANRQGPAELIMWGIFAGLAAGFATDYVLVASGG